MSDIKRLHSGPKLSRVLIHNGIVYLCGQVAHDYDADLEEQTRQTLARIDEHLAEAGTDRNRILSAAIHVKDISQVARMNAIWGEWLGDGPRPTRHCVQAEMANPKILVEITVTAAQ